MKKLLFAAVALVCAFGANLSAQTTTVTASHLKMAGADITVGTVTLTPVNLNGTPIAFADGTGAQNSPTAFQCNIASGAITTKVQPDGTSSGACTVPDATMTAPANILYAIQISNTSTGLSTSGKSYLLQAVVGVSGSTWALDHYGPPAPTTNVQALQASLGTSVPVNCVAPSVFTKTTDSTLWTCVGEVFVQVSGGSGVPSVNGIGSAVTITGTGRAAVSNSGSTVTVNVPQETTTSLTAALGGSPLLTPPAPSDVIGDYLYVSTTGSSVTDISGVTGAATIANSTGLVRDGLGFTHSTTSEVDYPTGLNGANTIYTLANFPPAVVGTTNNYLAAILSSSVATGGSLEILGYQPTTSNSGGIYGVWVRGSGNPITVSGDIYAGVHLITVVCTSSNSTSAIYVDTVQVTNFQSGPTACSGLQASGHFLNGPSASNPSLTPQGITIYRQTFASGSHSAATVATLGRSIMNQGRIAGVPIDPQIYRSSKRNWVFAGDSQTCGTGLTSSPACGVGTYSPLAHPTIAVANTTVNAYQVKNLGVPGEYVQGQLAALPTVYCPLANTNDGVSNATIQEGTNNFLTGGVTAAQVWAMLAAWGHGAAVCGFRPIVNTMSSRGGNDANGTSYDADMVALNALIRANWKSAGFAAIWDGGTWPAYGAVGAASNATNFPDTIHYSAGIQSTQGISEACLADRLDGSSPGNMNPAAVTATSSTMTCKDGGLNFNAVGGSINFTMLTAQFQTDIEDRFCNITPSGSNTVTITAPSDFPFNNVSGQTTKIIAAGSCLSVKGTWNGLTTSSTGAFWKTM